MARPNFLTLPRPPREEVTLTLSDPGQPTVEPFALTLRKPGPYEMTLAASHAQAFFDKWHETWYPLLTGEAIEVTLELAQMVASVQVMIVGGEEDPPDMEQLIGLMVNMPEAWATLMIESAKLLGTAEFLLGNPSGAASTHPSAPPSTSTSPTPNG